MNEEQSARNIDGLEATFMILVCLFFDGIDMLATFLDVFFGAGEFIKFFNNVIASSILYFWITMDEVSPTWTLVGAGLELIPLGNAFPIRTTTMAVTIYLDWHPKMIEGATPAIRVIAAAKKVNLKK